MKEKVAEVIETLRPMLQRDGGDVQLLNVDEAGGIVKVALQGACHGCPHAAMTLKMGIEARIKELIPGVQEVVAENM